MSLPLGVPCVLLTPSVPPRGELGSSFLICKSTVLDGVESSGSVRKGSVGDQLPVYPYHPDR